MDMALDQRYEPMKQSRVYQLTSNSCRCRKTGQDITQTPSSWQDYEWSARHHEDPRAPSLVMHWDPFDLARRVVIELGAAANRKPNGMVRE